MIEAQARALASEMIKRHERLMLQAYDDATGLLIGPGRAVRGHPTIGYGRALDLNGISPDEAEMLLERDLNRGLAFARIFLGQEAWNRLNEARAAALIDMVHNLGPGNLGKFVDFRRAVLDENWQAAHDEVLDSDYARRVKGRAVTIARVWLTGEPAEPLVA
jgi:lysozyme